MPSLSESPYLKPWVRTRKSIQRILNSAHLSRARLASTSSCCPFPLDKLFLIQIKEGTANLIANHISTCTQDSRFIYRSYLGARRVHCKLRAWQTLHIFLPPCPHWFILKTTYAVSHDWSGAQLLSSRMPAKNNKVFMSEFLVCEANNEVKKLVVSNCDQVYIQIHHFQTKCWATSRKRKMYIQEC